MRKKKQKRRSYAKVTTKKPKATGKHAKKMGLRLTLLERCLLILLLTIFAGGWYFTEEESALDAVQHDGVTSIFSAGQVSETAFIEQIGEYAQNNYENSGVLPSVVIAQAILESDFGKSELASTYNNLYGYKAHGDELAVSLPTLEYMNGVWIEVNEPFKVYDSWEASVRDHGNLMMNGTVWNPELYQAVINAADYTEATFALQTAGYATDPSYSQKLNTIIITHQLESFDSRK